MDKKSKVPLDKKAKQLKSSLLIGAKDPEKNDNWQDNLDVMYKG